MPTKNKNKTKDENENEAIATPREDSVSPLPAKKQSCDYAFNDENNDAATRDEQSAASSRRKSIAESKSATTVSSDSSGGSDDTEGEKTIIEKCLSKIPFTILVGLLMAIPVGFLVLYSILNFVASARTLSYASAHHDFLLGLGHCGIALTLERNAIGDVQIANNTKHWNVLQEHIHETHEECEHAIQLAMHSSDPRISDGWSTLWRHGLEELTLLRYQAIWGTVGTIEGRYKYTELLDILDKGRTVVATHPSMRAEMQTMIQLKLVWQAAINNDACGGSGGDILIHNDNGTASWDLIREFGEYRRSYLEFMLQLRELAHGAGEKFLHRLDSSAIAQQSLTMMDALWMDPFKDEHWVSSEDWIMAFEATFQSSMGLEAEFVDEVIDDATQQVVLEAVKLTAALVGCVFAAGLILKSNIMTQKKIDKTVKKSKTMQIAVQKFVPRAFLKMCGCTSILHVSAGDQTQVATTMLFSDIRNFAVVSGNMSNEELFPWLQSYFQRMTSITERNNRWHTAAHRTNNRHNGPFIGISSSPQTAGFCFRGVGKVVHRRGHCCVLGRCQGAAVVPEINHPR